MSVVFWILMVILILVFLVALFSSTQDNRRNRPFDLLVVTFNRDLNGALDNEQDKVIDLINKKRDEMREIRKQIEEGNSIFSDDQIEHCGIVKNKKLWLEMMYGMVNGDYRLKSNIEMSDEDFCVGFLVVLKYKGFGAVAA